MLCGGDAMEKTVYVDLLFLVNFSMDFLCFYISSKILAFKLSPLRGVIGAALGGIYSVVALFLPSLYGLSFFIDLAVCLLMCLVVWGIGKKGDIFLGFLFYFAVSMALGGFMTAIFNLLNRLGFNKIDAGSGDGISVWLFALIALISGAVTLIGGRFFRRRSSERYVELEISYGGKMKRISAFVDSGNLLCEPISGKSCVIIDTRETEGFLPGEIVSAAARGGVTLLAPSEHAKNIRLVPAKSATGEGLLVARKVDKMRIDSGNGMYETDALLALTSLEEKRALVPASLLR